MLLLQQILYLLIGMEVLRAPMDMEFSSDYLYVADWETGLWIFDISSPKSIQTVGIYKAWSAHVVGVSANIAYLAYEGKLEVLDVSNPHQVAVTRQLSLCR